MKLKFKLKINSYYIKIKDEYCISRCESKLSAKYGYLAAIADYANERCGCNWTVDVAKARVKSLVKQF